MILCLFLSNSSLIDWGWLSVGDMERWVISKSSLQPSDLGTCPVSSPPSLLFPLSWHTCPLRFLCSRCYVLRITKLFGSLCVEFWHLLLLPLSPTSLLAAFPILREGGRRWRWLISMVPPLTAFSSTFLECGTGTLHGHSHLFRGMETHGSNERIAGCAFLSGDAHFMVISNMPQYLVFCLRITEVRVNNVEI